MPTTCAPWPGKRKAVRGIRSVLLVREGFQFRDDSVVDVRADLLGGDSDGVGDGPLLRGAVADDADTVDAQQGSASKSAVVILAEHSLHGAEPPVLLRGQRTQD